MFASLAALFERQFAPEALMSSQTASRLSRWLIILSCCFAATSLKAADELLVYVFSAAGPVDGAVVAIDQILLVRLQPTAPCLQIYPVAASVPSRSQLMVAR